MQILAHTIDYIMFNLRYKGIIHRITTLSLSLVLSLLTACGSGDLTGVNGAIIDNPNNANKLKQLLTVINVVTPSGSYAVLDRIDSIKLNVDGQFWGSFSSAQLDRSGLITTVENDLDVADKETGYFLLAEYSLNSDDLSTAGEYANYLRGRLTLPPGDHICEIAEVQFKDRSNNTIIVKPRIHLPFRVEENVASIFLGKISISIN